MNAYNVFMAFLKGALQKKQSLDSFVEHPA